MFRKYNKNIIKKAKKLYINGYSQEEICKKLDIPHGSIWRLLKDISTNKRKKLPTNFTPKYHLSKNSKFMSKEKARIIGYLAAEGHVRLDEGYHKRIYYESNGLRCRQSKYKRATIAFYNKNTTLIKKYIKDFYKIYGIKTRYKKNKYEVSIHSIEVYKDLISYCKFGSKDWEIPQEILDNKLFSKEWLKAFYDGEAYVEDGNKKLIINSINKKGLISIKKILKQLKIESKIYGPYHWNNFTSFRLTIGRKQDIIKFSENIGFYHPNKKIRLQKIL